MLCSSVQVLEVNIHLVFVLFFFRLTKASILKGGLLENFEPNSNTHEILVSGVSIPVKRLQTPGETKNDVKQASGLLIRMRVESIQSDVH